MAEPDAPTRRRDTLLALASFAIVVAVVVLGAVLPAWLHPVVASTPSFFDREPTCAEWTDSCVVCQRGPQGAACSTPGIACVRTEPKCVRRIGT